MRHSLRSRIITALIAIGLGLSLFGAGGAAHAASGTPGAVYALTNAAHGNAVAVFDRAPDGTLTAAGTVPTGGDGTGRGLGSQGALVFGKGGKLLFAVNAGSNEISVFRVHHGSLKLVERVASGGTQPISLTAHDDMLVVLNAGDAGNITGFHIRDGGKLTPLPGSTRALSSAASGPAQVQFNTDGDLLAVTEKATNTIDIFRVDDDEIGPAQPQPSVGQTPFGFVFDHDRLIVSEAFGGAAGAGAASSYIVDDEGTIAPITGSLGNAQGAPCWVAIDKHGRYAYVANTGSGTVTAYRVGETGTLELVNADGVAGVTGPGTAPADLGLSHNGRLLYVRNGATGTISTFAVHAGGTLVALGTSGQLPGGAAGLAVR